jgi:site-specific recombinase XerD
MARQTQGNTTQRLSKRTVDAALRQERRYIIWDSDLPGFGLRIEPNGHKTFIIRYRAGGGRQGTLRQKNIGRVGTVTPEEARTAARKILGPAAAGGDPLGERDAARKAGITVTEVCDWFLREAGSGRLLGRRGQPIKPQTIALDRSRIEVHVKPLIGRKPVSGLSLKDMEGMQADIALGKTAAPVADGKRRRGGVATGGGGVAGRTLTMLHAIFEHAVRHQVIDANPARGARKIASGRKKARLSQDQLTAFGKALIASAATGESLTALAAIRLLCLTGLRRNEALGLRPEWILPDGGIDFPDTKSGPQVRPIGKSAVDLLRACVATNGAAEWVFPADRGEGHYVGLPKVLQRVAARAKVAGVTPHVLRHTFASVAADLGFSELTIAGLLGHSAGSVTSGYVHLDTALVAAADRVSATIAKVLDGKPLGRRRSLVISHTALQHGQETHDEVFALPRRDSANVDDPVGIRFPEAEVMARARK